MPADPDAPLTLEASRDKSPATAPPGWLDDYDYEDPPRPEDWCADGAELASVFLSACAKFGWQILYDHIGTGNREKWPVAYAQDLLDVDKARAFCIACPQAQPADSRTIVTVNMFDIVAETNRFERQDFTLAWSDAEEGWQRSTTFSLPHGGSATIPVNIGHCGYNQLWVSVQTLGAFRSGLMQIDLDPVQPATVRPAWCRQYRYGPAHNAWTDPPQQYPTSVMTADYSNPHPDYGGVCCRRLYTKLWGKWTWTYPHPLGEVAAWDDLSMKWWTTDDYDLAWPDVPPTPQTIVETWDNPVPETWYPFDYRYSDTWQHLLLQFGKVGWTDIHGAHHEYNSMSWDIEERDYSDPPPP